MNFRIEHLSKSYEKKQVLRDIDFTFEASKIYGLLGRNGAGKTTLFNCLNKDIKSDCGRFYFEQDGQNLVWRNAGETLVISPWGENSLRVRAAKDGVLRGEVKNVVFKGVHYEISVDAVGLKWIIHSTQSAAPGALIGMDITPEDIHIMKRMEE